ncbi:PREDICTED: uncharacterized protein LOC108972245 [Bactrocera latifrons]|uniref:Regulatory protein zeste n=3 Tax=Bactrocera latifrons TaxID=174628 RepID=A0A0K8UIW9_BACLA|nr:PREDICTED: uncharacterized protein LOC108972245 [Bactrocera latifrons]
MGRHKNGAQEAIMVKFMQEYPDLACGTLSNKQLRNYLWNLLANKLNVRGPPRKTPERWKKVWFDWRSAVKRKIVQERNEAAAGDQDDLQIRKTFLSSIENKLAHICGFLDNDINGIGKLNNADTNNEVSVTSEVGFESGRASVSEVSKDLGADADIHAKSIKQEDFRGHYDSITNVIKEELILDETDNEMLMDSDTDFNTFDFGDNRNIAETECITVQPFVMCHSTLSEVKSEIQNSDAEHPPKEQKKAKTNDQDVVQLVSQQTTLIKSVSELIKETAKGQAESLSVMKDIRHGLKEMFESINKLNEATAEKLKEQRRHNYEIEKLRREEMLLQKQQLELNELAIFRKD